MDSHEPYLAIFPRKRGRPRAQEPGVRLTTWINASDYDQLLRLANAREQSLSSLVRETLRAARKDRA